jgi:hypothetical protein
VNCGEGKHGPLVAGEPIHYETCVNVAWSCAHCGVVVVEDSYTAAEWVRRGKYLVPRGGDVGRPEVPS